MKNVLAALRLVLADLAALQNKGLAAVIAGGVAAIIAAVAGVHLTPAEVAGWLVFVGGVAATLEKVPVVKAAKAQAAKARARRAK